MGRQQRAAARVADIKPTFEEMRESGAQSLRAIAAGLNERGIPTAHGASAWIAVQVQRTNTGPPDLGGEPYSPGGGRQWIERL